MIHNARYELKAYHSSTYCSVPHNLSLSTTFDPLSSSIFGRIVAAYVATWYAEPSPSQPHTIPSF